MIVGQKEVCEMFGICAYTVIRKVKDGIYTKLPLKGCKFELKSIMKEQYGDDWKYFYNKYLQKKIAELEKLKED